MDYRPYPPYSPDLATTNYHLSRPLSNYLREKKVDDEKIDLINFIVQKLKDFCEREIISLPERWQQVIDSDGAYITES